MKLLNTILITGLCLFTSQAIAKTSALIVGINQYDHLDNLYGAVNDAHLIRDSLFAKGIRDVLTLTDKSATKKAIYQRWIDMVANASKGDVLIFTYSGHGGFEKDKDNEPNETDGKDQTFMLSNFAKGPYVKTSDFRIVDDEIHDWFYMAKTKGIKIIFVADSCYSGTMTRSLDNLKNSADEYDLSDEDLPPSNYLSPNRNKHLVENDLPHVVFFYSSSDKQTTPEYNIQGKPHGMLSWAFANAISGKADKSRDGNLTKDEIEKYMKEIVRTYTNSIQVIGSKPKGSPNTILFTKNKPLRKPASNHLQPALYISGSLPKGGLHSYKKVNSQRKADLIWNVKTGVVSNDTQDKISHGIFKTKQMQGVIEKWQLLNQLKKYVLNGGYATSQLIKKRDPSHIGDRVIFSITDIRYPYLTQFNLAGDGTLQFLYPMNKTEQNYNKKGSFKMPLDITLPVGGDQLVSIYSNKPLIKLHQLLKSYNDSKSPLEISKQLSKSLSSVNYQVSIIDLYTVEK